MANHAKFLATATRLIKKHGRPVSFKKLGAGAADPARPWGSPVPGTDVTVGPYMGCFVPYMGSGFGDDWKDFDLTKYADQILLVAGVPGVALEESHMVVDGKESKIEWVQILKPADLIILYAFGVNR